MKQSNDQISPKRKWIGILLKCILTLTLLFFALRWFEYLQTFQPSRIYRTKVEDAHQNAKEVTLHSGPKCHLKAWWIPCLENAPYQDWVIVFSHGNAGNISHRQDFYKTWLALGFNILAYDYRGYGKSTGRPSESGSYQDLRAAIEWVNSNGFPKNRILLLGKSLGGGVTTEIAKDGKVAGAILHSTFTSIPDLGVELFPFLPVRLISAIRYDTKSKLKDTHIPVLILHSQEDSLIRYHHAESNFAAANNPKLLRSINGDHNDSEWERQETLKHAIDDFMNLLN